MGSNGRVTGMMDELFFFLTFGWQRLVQTELQLYSIFFVYHLGVSKNRGIPKWMVKIMENPIKMDDLGVPLFLETPILLYFLIYIPKYEVIRDNDMT